MPGLNFSVVDTTATTKTTFKKHTGEHKKGEKKKARKCGSTVAEPGSEVEGTRQYTGDCI